MAFILTACGFNARNYVNMLKGQLTAARQKGILRREFERLT
jgi:hypothetical protein